MEEKTTPTIKILKEHWFIIAFILTIAVTWGTTQNQIATMKTQLSVLELKTERNDLNQQELKNTLIRMETTLEFIKNSLSQK